MSSLAGFLLLTLAYDHEPLATIDDEVAVWVAGHMPTVIEWAARPFSWLGGWYVTATIVVGLVVVLIVARRAADAFWASAAIIGMHLVATPLVKEAFDRPRPDAGSAVALPPSDAFPSGHATGAVATFGVLVALGAERWPRRARELWLAASLLVFAIGASRIVLNVHWVTDVVAGWLLGAAWLAAVLLLRNSLR